MFRVLFLAIALLFYSIENKSFENIFNQIKEHFGDFSKTKNDIFFYKKGERAKKDVQKSRQKTQTNH